MSVVVEKDDKQKRIYQKWIGAGTLPKRCTSQLLTDENEFLDHYHPDGWPQANGKDMRKWEGSGAGLCVRCDHNKPLSKSKDHSLICTACLDAVRETIPYQALADL
jgi:hypothetical protein